MAAAHTLLIYPYPLLTFLFFLSQRSTVHPPSYGRSPATSGIVATATAAATTAAVADG